MGDSNEEISRGGIPSGERSRNAFLEAGASSGNSDEEISRGGIPSGERSQNAFLEAAAGRGGIPCGELTPPGAGPAGGAKVSSMFSLGKSVDFYNKYKENV